MKKAFEPLTRLKAIKEIKESIKKPGYYQISGCIEAQKKIVAALLCEEKKFAIYVNAHENKCREIMHLYQFYGGDGVFYPARDLLFHGADVHGDEIAWQRAAAYKHLVEGKDIAVFTTPDSFMDAIPAYDRMVKDIFRISEGDVIDMSELEDRLASIGYERNYQVEVPGEFAIRGGIVDIYPLSEEVAYRIEFFGDDVESVRSIDPESQRTIEEIGSVEIHPQESAGGEGECSFFSYFDPSETLVIVDNVKDCVNKCAEVEQEIVSSREHRGEDNVVKVFGTDEITEMISRFPVVILSPDDSVFASVTEGNNYHIKAVDTRNYHDNFGLLIDDLKKYKRRKAAVLLVSASKSRAERFAYEFSQEGLNSFYTQDLNHEIKPGEVMLTSGRPGAGCEFPEAEFVIITDGDLFEKRKKRRRKKTYDGETISSFSDLHVGDYVVHENHGMGIYRGIEQIRVEGTVRDFLKLEYAKGGVLFVQVTQLDLIQKYSGAEGTHPKLNSLTGGAWKKTKAKVKSSVDEIATDLVELYATRQEQSGFVYGPDTIWQKEFEEAFPYEETGDQLAAIAAVKQDMESDGIMDRLLCGDVGFGKTEVAIRAAFKAVQEGKQVAYLVPTTILAQQHYETFASRMKGYPVRVDLLCRFRSRSEQTHTVADLKKGAVDIVIGTHRLLSSDISFKDLGLLIIDEEQRFGVGHKEKIKKLKNDVDVLSLTATPIPRTLHMSLIGIRDMSILEEAPGARRPVQTFVTEMDPEVVREALERELRRGGQVFYVYNHVDRIADKARAVEQLVPNARVAYAHGQMRETELEDIMYDFIKGEIDILVSTTIVETGLDISNVNTIIIEEADKMGLSQLYQLRGRVGRSDRLAYAFLMYKKDKLLKEVAEKRLGAIREFSALGSGLRIAMRDLEIRGAGNLLGKSQSGNMQAVGYDLYCKMLNEAVKNKKGIATTPSYDTVIEINIDAYIPESYISDEFRKLDMYKRISRIEDRKDREDMEAELTDRFGNPPKSVQVLMRAAEMKAAAHRVYITSISGDLSKTRLDVFAQASINAPKMMEFLAAYPKKLYFIPNPEPRFEYISEKDIDEVTFLDNLIALFEEMREKILDVAPEE
ncbi:MAG: transcription-repair coupling factor [Eubacterium sp.]|nr:transcription-repair coupling factor [Eubacterium sp.]